tara:strand:- start:904 stop:1182 length:279 start_codon:yes stop_codon:yes gene_type:complete
MTTTYKSRVLRHLKNQITIIEKAFDTVDGPTGSGFIVISNVSGMSVRYIKKLYTSNNDDDFNKFYKHMRSVKSTIEHWIYDINSGNIKLKGE